MNGNNPSHSLAQNLPISCQFYILTCLYRSSKKPLNDCVVPVSTSQMVCHYKQGLAHLASPPDLQVLLQLTLVLLRVFIRLFPVLLRL